MMVNGFFNKTLNYRTNNIIYSRWRWWNGICDEYVDVETVHLGIYGTATHELGTFLFQHVLASNESKHP
jgi:hypothetical protein